MKKFLFSFKAVFYLVKKYAWLVFGGIIFAVVVIFLNKKKNEAINNISEKISREQVNFDIEVSKIRADTNEKINELEDIKKVDDNSERLKKLAAFLTNEFNK